MIINLPLTFQTANKTTIRNIDIAKACNVTRSMASWWLTGKRTPNAEQSRKISELFKAKGIEPAYLK